MKKRTSLLQRTLVSLLPVLIWCSGTSLAAENQAVIDVLLVFDKTASEHIRQTMVQNGNIVLHPMNEEQTAELAITQLNRVLANSGIGKKVKFRNAGILRSSYRTTTRTNGAAPENAPHDLEAMRLGGVEGLEEARAKSKADLVILFTYYPITGPAIVGGALPLELNSLYMPTERYEKLYKDMGSKEGFATSFNVLTIRAKDTTFSHEVCHLLGAGHSDSQLMQCGPQAEMDAAGCYPGSEAYATLMSYADRKDVNTNNLQEKSSRQLAILSHPARKTENGVELTLGDENYHNNAAVVVRHASAVAAFRVSGREKVINDSPKQAISMPAFVPFREKLERLLWGKFYAELQTGELQTRIARILVEQEKVNPAALSMEQLTEIIWMKKKDIFPSLVHENECGFRGRYIDEEFMRHESSQNHISCTLGTTIGATKENGEPVPAGGSGKTVWYKVVTPGDGDLEVAVRRSITTEGFRPAMGIYFASGKTKLQQLEHKVNPDAGSGLLKSITANVPGNTTLYIAIDSEQGSPAGNFCLITRHKNGTYTGKPLTGSNPADGGDEGSKDEDTIPPGDDAPERQWDGVDTTLLVFCLLMFLSTAVMGYLLWLQNFRRKISAEQEPEKEQKLPTPPIPEKKSGQTLSLQGTLSNGSQVSYDIDLLAVKKAHNYYIGRDAEQSQTVIRDSTVSKRHAVLKVRRDENGEMLLMGDAGSSNGTCIDGVWLKADECVKIKWGQVVQMGNCTFRIIQK